MIAVAQPTPGRTVIAPAGRFVAQVVAPADLPPMIGPPGSQGKTPLRRSPLSCVPMEGIRSNREFIRAQERDKVNDRRCSTIDPSPNTCSPTT